MDRSTSLIKALDLLTALGGAGESDHRVRVASAPATRHNIRHNALGKLFLSQRPDLAAGWVDCDPDFADELKTIRETGIAWNRGETVAGMVALACHGFDRAATEPKLAVAWPEARFSTAKAERAVRALQKILPRFE
jgi:DNA-binding IclR family transcriptional regulator